MTDMLLFEEMQHPVTGVSVKSRKILRPLGMGYKRFKECFTGTDAVSWLVAHRDDGSRSNAALVLQSWLDKSLVKRVGTPTATLDDRNSFFQFAHLQKPEGKEKRLPKTRIVDGDLTRSNVLQMLQNRLFQEKAVVLGAALVSAARVFLFDYYYYYYYFFFFFFFFF
jgi:hypothetical protein